MKSSNITSKTKKSIYFIPQSRLNRGQRKYCHCLMKFRLDNTKGKKKTLKLKNTTPVSKSQYYQCKNIANFYKNKFKPKKKGKTYNQYDFNPFKTNCVNNYNYDNYTIDEIRVFCLEKKIPIQYTVLNKDKNKDKNKIKNKDKNKDKNTKNITKYYSKEYLISKLMKHYLKNHKSKKFSKKKKKKTKKTNKTNK